MITRHYKRIVKDILQRGGAKYDAYAVTASDGRPYYTAQEQPNYSADQTAMSMNTDQPGVIIGSGTAAESETSYWLAQQITSGFSGSVLPTHEMVNSTHTLCLYVTITNTGSSSITVSEIGYALITPLMRRPSDSQFIGSPYAVEKNVLIDRTVLTSPITIAAGNSVRLKYALKTTDEIFSGSVILIQKTISANGVYNASSDNANGYSEVTVNVTPTLQSKTATQNGTVTPDQGYDGLSSVLVNVSGGGGSEGIYVGVGDPDASIGSNGDYYYKRKRTGMYGYTSTPQNSSRTSQTGYEFIANEAIAISGLRAYNVNTSGTISLLLAKLDGTVLGRIDNVQANGGWAEASFETEVQLTAGEHYIVQAIRSSDYGFRYQSKSSTAFNSKITGVQGRYGSLPGNADSANIYSADIIIATADSVYVVTKQYHKSSGAWEVIV